jgi:hypothetical protein
MSNANDKLVASLSTITRKPRRHATEAFGSPTTRRAIMNHNTGMSEYNIDRLRRCNTDQFELCSRRIAKGALETDHVTHLQRFCRTVAMRKTVTNVARYGQTDEVRYTLDFSNRTCEQFDNLNRAIDRVVDYLNQGEHNYEAGDCLSDWCNQASRTATVLAVLGEEILIEVEMPGTTAVYGRHGPRATSFIVQYNVRLGERRDRKSISYNACPKRWLAEMRKNGMDWIGMGQRMIEPLPFPK